MHHANVIVWAILCTVSAPDAPHGIDIHFAAFVPENRVARRAVRQAHRVLTMAAGTRHQQVPENVSLSAIEPRLPLMRACTGIHALIAPNALVFINKQDVGALEYPAINHLVDEMLPADLTGKHLGTPHQDFLHLPA